MLAGPSCLHPKHFCLPCGIVLCHNTLGLFRVSLARPAASTHDRLTAPHSLSRDEAFAREGWTWSFPSDASTATIVGKDCY